MRRRGQGTHLYPGAQLTLSASWSPERPGETGQASSRKGGHTRGPGGARRLRLEVRAGLEATLQAARASSGEDGGPFLWAGGLGLEVAFLCVRGYVAACVTGHTSSACLSWTPPQRLLPAVTMGLVSPAVHAGLWVTSQGSCSEVGGALRITSRKANTTIGHPHFINQKTQHKRPHKVVCLERTCPVEGCLQSTGGGLERLCTCIPDGRPQKQGHHKANVHGRRAFTRDHRRAGGLAMPRWGADCTGH